MTLRFEFNIEKDAETS